MFDKGIVEKIKGRGKAVINIRTATAVDGDNYEPRIREIKKNGTI